MRYLAVISIATASGYSAFHFNFPPDINFPAEYFPFSCSPPPKVPLHRSSSWGLPMMPLQWFLSHDSSSTISPPLFRDSSSRMRIQWFLIHVCYSMFPPPRFSLRDSPSMFSLLRFFLHESSCLFPLPWVLLRDPPSMIPPPWVSWVCDSLHASNIVKFSIVDPVRKQQQPANAGLGKSA